MLIAECEGWLRSFRASIDSATLNLSNELFFVLFV